MHESGGPARPTLPGSIRTAREMGQPPERARTSFATERTKDWVSGIMTGTDRRLSGQVPTKHKRAARLGKIKGRERNFTMKK